GTTRYSGSLEPVARVDMAFRIGGYVDMVGEVSTSKGKRPLDKGDFVTKGTVLARIRTNDYGARVASASAQLAEARANEQLAQDDLGRAKRLFDDRAIPKAELDAKVARAQSVAAQVKAAMSRTNEAGVALGDTVLRAPMDGVVLSRQIEVGALVSPGQPAISLADTRTVKAVFGAPQLLVEKIHVCPPVSVCVGAEAEHKTPEKLLEAHIPRIAPAADANGRLFSVEAALPNDAGELRPGSVVAVHVPDADPRTDSLVVPLSAVIRSPSDPHG